MQGDRASFRVDLGYTELFHIPAVTSVSFWTCAGLLGDSLEFGEANRGSLRVGFGIPEFLCTQCRGFGPHLTVRVKSHGFSRVEAGTWAIFSSYGGDVHWQLEFVQRRNYSCLVKKDISGI